MKTDQNWDPLAPGQNNEGYGITPLTIASATVETIPPGGGLRRSNVKAAEDSLSAVDTSGKLEHGLVVAYLGRPLSVRIRAVAEGTNIESQQRAYVYDGSGSNRQMIAGKTLAGIHTNGSHAWFQWTPTTLGLHQLTAELPQPLGNLSQGGNIAKLSVIVVRAPGDVNGDGVVDARDMDIISGEIGKPLRESACGSLCDLNGDGFIGKADLDLGMMHCDHAYCALPPVADVSNKAIDRKQTKH